MYFSNQHLLINEHYLIVGLGIQDIKVDSLMMYKILLIIGFVLLGHAAYSAVQCKDADYLTYIKYVME